MGELFGTDGIRGIANEYPVDFETGMKLGKAIVQFCEMKKLSKSVVIGRDTRVSGEFLSSAVVSGILSAGGKAFQAGVIPTPGVAFLTRDLKAGAGIVISASHNPYEYNGFKIFTDEGLKLSRDDENLIESIIMSSHGKYEGSIYSAHEEILEDAEQRYISFLLKKTQSELDFNGIKAVIDCANGATYSVAPLLFKKLGVKFKTLFAEPDGSNINKDCGSQHIDTLKARVIEIKADVGLAFDGDGDRLIAVDEKGGVLTGDQLMVIFATMLKDMGRLDGNIVVSTVMSNLGMRAAMKEYGINYFYTDVGDRNVMEELKLRGGILGGEESGHIIFLDTHSTGDGMIAALNLLTAMKWSGKSLSLLSSLMKIYPQTMINVPITRKPEISKEPVIVEAIKKAEKDLGENGRVLVRYSGTEPVCRVMVEGRELNEIEAYAKKLAETVSSELN